jgi:hypothetical protein
VTDPWHRYVLRGPDTPGRDVAGEVVVVTARDSVLHSLNATATFVWDRADGTRTLEQIAAAMLDEFDVDPATLRRELVDFVDTAVSRGLLLLADAPAAAR